MSFKNIPLPPEVITKWEQERTSVFKTGRSTYSDNNANEFKDFFLDIIKDQENRQILYSELPHLKPATIYQKAVDALRFLCDNEPNPDTRIKYLELRNNFKFSKGQHSLLFYRRARAKSVIAGKPVVIDIAIYKDAVSEQVKEVVKNKGESSQKEFELPSEPKIVTWRHKVENFINTGPIGEPYKLDIATLTQEDMVWIAGICGGVSGLDYIINGTELHLIKE